MNLSEHLCVDKELFYGTKCNKIYILLQIFTLCCFIKIIYLLSQISIWKYDFYRC